MSDARIEANKKIVRRWIELANANDFDGLATVWAEDCILHQGEGVDDVHGFAAFKGLLESFYVGMPDLEITIEDIIGQDDLVIMRTFSRATHTGELLGIPPTRRKVAYAGIQTYRLADGKISEEWFNDDLFALVGQLTG